MLWTQTDPSIQIKLRSSVLSVALAVVLAALVVLIVSVALIVFVAGVSVALVVAVVAAAVVVVAVATLNISRFLTKTMIAKVPAVVAGTFLYKVKHMKQVTVHRIIVLVIISI